MMKRKEKILIVDDDRKVLDSCRRILLDENYRIAAFTSPWESLRQIDDFNPDVILADQYMKKMFGTVFLARARMISSNFIGMVMTGHNDDAAVVSAFARGEIFRIIPKPWNDAEFKTAVRQAFDYYTRLQRESDTVFYESYIARRS